MTNVSQSIWPSPREFLEKLALSLPDLSSRLPNISPREGESYFQALIRQTDNPNRTTKVQRFLYDLDAFGVQFVEAVRGAGDGLSRFFGKEFGDYMGSTCRASGGIVCLFKSASYFLGRPGYDGLVAIKDGGREIITAVIKWNSENILYGVAKFAGGVGSLAGIVAGAAGPKAGIQIPCTVTTAGQQTMAAVAVNVNAGALPIGVMASVAGAAAVSIPPSTETRGAKAGDETYKMEYTLRKRLAGIQFAQDEEIAGVFAGILNSRLKKAIEARTVTERLLHEFRGQKLGSQSVASVTFEFSGNGRIQTKIRMRESNATMVVEWARKEIE